MQTHLFSNGEMPPGLGLVCGDVLVGGELPICPLVDGGCGFPIGSGYEESSLGDDKDLDAQRL